MDRLDHEVPIVVPLITHNGAVGRSEPVVEHDLGDRQPVDEAVTAETALELDVLGKRVAVVLPGPVLVPNRARDDEARGNVILDLIPNLVVCSEHLAMIYGVVFVTESAERSD